MANVSLVYVHGSAFVFMWALQAYSIGTCSD